MLRQVAAVRVRIVVALEVVATLCVVGAILMLINQVYVNKAEIQVLIEREATEADTRAKIDKSFRAELDDIYRTIYTAPDPQRPPAGIELWQKNRDKELRDRLSKLEQWRYRTER